MDDMQMFPDTVEEFMEQYKMVDTENVYSNGIEYVPIFRMKQWFEKHPERKKGHWIHISDDVDGNSWYECSCCHKGEVHVPIIEVAYCWNCGADMR